MPTSRPPYSPPPDVDEVDADESFDDLPSDVELNFNDRLRGDPFDDEEEEEDDFEEDLWDDEDDNGEY